MRDSGEISRSVALFTFMQVSPGTLPEHDSLPYVVRHDAVGEVTYLEFERKPSPPLSGIRIPFATLTADDRGFRGTGDILDDVPDADRFRIALFNPLRVDRTSIMDAFPWHIDDDQGLAFGFRWQLSDSPGESRYAMYLWSREMRDEGRDPVLLLGDDAQRSMLAANLIQQSEMGSATPTTATEPIHFKSLSIQGYRGFSQQAQVEFAVPNGSPGSGLTIIVGANNSGKSTLIEALEAVSRGRQISRLSFPQSRRSGSGDAPVKIRLLRDDGHEVSIESARPGSSDANVVWRPVPSGGALFDVTATPARRQFSHYFGVGGTTDRWWASQGQEFSRTDNRNSFVSRLRDVHDDASGEKLAAFNELFGRIVGNDVKWTIDSFGPGQDFFKFIEHSASHSSEGLGEGLISVMFIVDAIRDSSTASLIAIDEPELSLHPQHVRRLGDLLAEYAATRQIVIATHSPLLLSWEAIHNGARVVRVYKEDGHSRIAQPRKETLADVSKLHRSGSNPHVLGVSANEAFFLEDGIVLVEGQDDAAYLPRVLADLELPRIDNIYGWGSGGADNIPRLARLFDELGFTRIAAILDDNRPDVAELLQRETPSVFVRAIPAADIRHKAASTREEVPGLLDSSNRHVRPELREATSIVLSEVSDHIRR